MAPAHELDWARSTSATPQNSEAMLGTGHRQGASPIRVEILGAPIDVLSMEDTVSRARDAMREKSPIVQVSMNVAKLVDMRRNPELRHDVLSSDIVSADGMGVVLAGRLLGLQLRNRVAGIDLMMALLALCARDGFR